jgi:hypothetical protein
MHRNKGFEKTFLAVVVFVFFTLAQSNASGQKKLILHFFGSPTCGECLDIKEKILFPAVKNGNNTIDLRIYDVDSDSGFALMLKMEELHKTTSSASIELFFPDTFLIGSEDILLHGQEKIESYLKHPEQWGDTPEDPKLSTPLNNVKVLKR